MRSRLRRSKSGAIAFEDDEGAVRIFVGNHLDRARNVLIEFRGHTARVDMAAGELREVHLIGKPSDRTRPRRETRRRSAARRA